MSINFKRFEANELEELIGFLTSDRWEFHGVSVPDGEKIREFFAKGYYDSDNTRTFWIMDGDSKVGMIRIYDITDFSPMFDLRIGSSHRGRGVGKTALLWLTEYIFKTWENHSRIEGQTRQDNIAMRKVFWKCGYIKEAHYRKAWRDDKGKLYDSIGYGILKEDWEKGITTPVNWDDEDFLI